MLNKLLKTHFKYSITSKSSSNVKTVYSKSGVRTLSNLLNLLAAYAKKRSNMHKFQILVSIFHKTPIFALPKNLGKDFIV